MKNFLTCFSAILIFLPAALTAQNFGENLRLKNGNVLLEKNIPRDSSKIPGISKALYKGRYFILVRFEKLPSEISKQQMATAGLQLVEFVSGTSWIAEMTEKMQFQQLARFGVVSAKAFPPEYKIDQSILDRSYKPGSDGKLVALSYVKTVSRDVVKKDLFERGVNVIPNKFEKPGLLFVNGSLEQFLLIAELPYITYIAPQVVSSTSINYNNNGAHSNTSLTYSGPGGRALSGKGVAIGVGDNGDVSTHLDFSGRLINRNGYVPNDHGTHTTGTAAGGGLIDIKNKGMAPKATIVSQYYNDIIANAPTYITDYRMNLTNNSYYSALNGCQGEGVYDDLSNYVDQQSKNNKELLHVIASGNDGSLGCSPYPASFATVKSGWQSAKNVLTVGAYDNFSNIIANFSSRGPLKDGRIKPEIVTGGWGIYSTTTNNNYNFNYGTSMAAPTATGSLALLTQRYKELNGNENPSSALLKALVCNTAEDKGNAGPDFTFGFGNLNSRRAVEAMEGHRYFQGAVTTGSSNAHVISIPSGGYQLKVLITWTDKEAASLSASTLVNDLDLRVTEPFGATHQSLILNSSPAGVNAPAVEGADHTNNIEQVVINNPVGGDYTINVNGYSIPYGPQDYVVTYELVMPGIIVEYPAGGEKIVNGETEYVRWSAYGTGSQRFLLEFSEDNGGSWTPMDTASYTARVYAWSVPVPNATEGALIRISALETGFSDQCDHPFTTMQRPSLSIAQTCPGSVVLGWTPSNGATGYEILMLDFDSMKVIATTTFTTYHVHNLNPNKEYWFSVRPLNGTGSGRQSISKKIVANGGPCSLNFFDNDLALLAITAPVNGREFTANASNATQPVKVQVKNRDNVTSSGSFNLSYSINGATPVTETIAPVIAAGGIYTHTFANQSILGGAGSYNIKTWITRVGDTEKGNDTATSTVRLLANPPLTLPFEENFETSGNETYQGTITGLNGLDNFDFRSSTTRGRARSFVNTGFAYDGSHAITLDQTPYNVNNNADSLVMTNNLSNYSLANNQLWLDFYYILHGADDVPGNKVWIRGSETSAWVEAYDLYIHQQTRSVYTAASAININELLSNAVPPQDVSSTMQIKFGEEGYASANSLLGNDDISRGFSFDKIQISLATNDVGISQVVSPTKAGCALTSNTPVTIKLRNYNNVLLSNIQVNYRINGGPTKTEIVNQLNPNQVLDYTFSSMENFAAYIDYEIDFWINSAGDTYKGNDSILHYSFHNSPVISSFPYLETFESGNGYWYAQGINPSWQWGTPAKTKINGSANGMKAWVTGVTGNYKDNEYSYLYSPCFNLSGLSQPALAFSHILQIEDDCDCDYHWIEYSDDAGSSWHKLGAQGSGTNWFDDATTQKWQHSKDKWHVASIDLPVTGNNIRFRFVMHSDGGVTKEGVGIDDIHIYDKMPLYAGPSFASVQQNVNGNGWTDFATNGQRIASINSNGQDLGLTNVQAYFNQGPVRNSFNQYQLDRNLVINTAAQPTKPVSIRIYFTDKEADTLMKATGCGTCTTIYDPYRSAILKYSGTAGEENGTLSDNASGSYYVIPPVGVEVVPYENGYYAEFTVNSFSEFWINDGISTFPQPYVFIGNGNWNVASNWSNNSIPPSPLPAGKEIFLNPTLNCILNVPFTVLSGGKIMLSSGKNFIIQGNLNLQ